MQAFSYELAGDVGDAVARGGVRGAMFVAGGTDVMQLMKDDIAAPTRLVDIAGLPLDGIAADGAGMRLGALARMSDVAAHAGVAAHYPVVAQALLASASPQLRNMGTMGGNLLQRTRCGYFRDAGSACNKRVPGSGCPAIGGRNRMLGILGVSGRCIATHPSDLAVALVALDAGVVVQGAGGAARTIPLSGLHVLPGETPQRETVLEAGELITGVRVDGGAQLPGQGREAGAGARSFYLKVRDRAAFEFAVVSVAVALELEGGRIRRARLAAGGVAPKPWRLPAVEHALVGVAPGDAVLRSAAALAIEGAVAQSENGFKLPLLERAVFRAVRMAVDGAGA